YRCHELYTLWMKHVMKHFEKLPDVRQLWKDIDESSAPLTGDLSAEIRETLEKLKKSQLFNAKEEAGDVKIKFCGRLSPKSRMEAFNNAITDSMLIQTLDILDMVVSSIETVNAQYEQCSKSLKSEMTYYRRFASILDILLRDTAFDISE
ncbi:hypothetical protein EC973_006487, partial [Apophysomyces ossiformis]